MSVEEALHSVCYECLGGGGLRRCRECDRSVHAECAGSEEHAGKKGDKAAGLVCRICSKADRQSEEAQEALLAQVQKFCSKFPANHFASSFCRQVTRLRDLKGMCAIKGVDPAGCMRAADVTAAIRDLSVLTGQLTDDTGVASVRGQSVKGPGKGSAAEVLKREGGERLHCDVCGYINVTIGCATCIAAFHPLCLNMSLETALAVPPDWQCRSCLHEDTRVEAGGGGGEGGGVQEALEDSDVGFVNSKCVQPDRPVLCASCGFHEQDCVQCEPCLRWFCFGCTALSLQTLPAGAFVCPECCGIDTYDGQLARRNELVRRRIGDGNIAQIEVDMFAQMVFDLMTTCAWAEFSRNMPVLAEMTERQIASGVPPTILPYHSVQYPMPKEAVRRVAQLHSAQTLDRVRLSEGLPGDAEIPHMWQEERVRREPGERLRIGYMSADFVNHPTADLMQSALLMHDQERFEVFLYSISRQDGSVYRKVLQRELPNFRVLSNQLSDRKCAEAVAQDGVHVLINLNSHTQGERNAIFAYRPAPIQCIYLAYPGTHGASYIDYNIVDKTVCPREHREHYTEALVYMPHCYQANSFRDLYAEVHDPSQLPTRALFGLPEDAVVFCTFNRLGRLTPDVFSTWIRILQRVPNSVMWLYKHPTFAALRLLREARKQGLDASRFVFSGPVMPKVEHLKRLTLADLYLDTLVYNGHTTGSDVLWAGVPMITLQGDTFPSRVGASLARAIDMPEMIVHSFEDYEERAVELAINKEMLQEWRKKLATKRGEAPLFDSARWVHSFEDGLVKMWHFYKNERKPEDIYARDAGSMQDIKSYGQSRKKWKEVKEDAAELALAKGGGVVTTSPSKAKQGSASKALAGKKHLNKNASTSPASRGMSPSASKGCVSPSLKPGSSPVRAQGGGPDQVKEAKDTAPSEEIDEPAAASPDAAPELTAPAEGDGKVDSEVAALLTGMAAGLEPLSEDQEMHEAADDEGQPEQNDDMDVDAPPQGG